MTEPIRRNEVPSFSIDVKKGGRASIRRKDSNRKTEEVYCHQRQRGRLLEILSLMAKKEKNSSREYVQQKAEVEVE